MPRKMTKNAPAKVNAALRRREVAELRASKMTWQDIADQLGISETRVRQLHGEFFEQFIGENKELAEQIKRQQLEDIQLLKAKWFPIALDPKNGTKPLDSMTKLMAHEASLTGSKAPTENKTALTGADGGPLQSVAATVDLSKLDTDRLAMLYAMLQDLQAGAPPAP